MVSQREHLNSQNLFQGPQFKNPFFMATDIHAREPTVSASCVCKTRSPKRKQEPFELSDSVLNSPVAELVKKYEDPKFQPHQYVGVTDKPFLGKVISLMGRLSCTHERGVRVVSEAWLLDSIEKQEVQPLEAYDIATDLAIDGKGIPWDKQVPEEHAIESLSAKLKLYGKREVYKGTRLQEQCGEIFSQS
ncbi:hypothetical protein GOBAR_AA19535 [Gossypium barbadense]|uniref:BRCT domain-containing protein n=1 Tax=Gossypium barbadense TaxID=3634 RepID=A0A2P5XCS3_GOSBA|nr:hypothetical protein GOBAR_AA19535 [Gossypium barbadense]